MKGYLTIYMTLSLTVILSIVMALIVGVRQNTARMETEIAADTAMQSVLAEYHREMWKQYDLLFVDMSYGTDNPAFANTEAHIQDYTQENLPQTQILQMNAEGAEILEASLATDQNGEVFRQQVLRYMKDMSGINDLEMQMKSYQEAQQYDPESTNVEKKWEENEKTIQNLPTPQKKTSTQHYDKKTKKIMTEEKTEDVPIDNPTEQTIQMKQKGILELVVKNPEKISMQSVSIDQLASHRTLQTGTGVNPELKNSQDRILEGISDEFLYQTYVFQKCGYYGKELEKSALKYQIEYILTGKNNDVDNLKGTVQKLLLLREASNLAYLCSDREKMAEVQAMAAGIAAVAVAPEIQPLLEAAIVFAWTYLESIQDVRSLLDNGKVPVVKAAKDWQTGIEAIMAPQEKTAQKKENGLNYQQYLFLMMSFEAKETKLFRTMDIMEMDIRKTPYNENFRMDGCADSLQVVIKTMTKGGYNCSITRRYGYS